MKLSNTLCSLLAGGTLVLVSADSNHSLRRGLEACLELTNISFSSCTGPGALEDIGLALQGTGCSNTAKQEAKLLTGTSTVAEAKQVLKAHCAATRSACIPDPYALNFPNCEVVTLMDVIAIELANLGCDHSNKVEIRLLTGVSTLNEAQAIFATGCAATLDSCLGSLDSFSLTGVTCQGTPIREEITAKLNQVGTCTHSIDQEYRLLTGKATNSEANAAMKQKCIDERSSCTSNGLINVAVSTCDVQPIVNAVKAQMTDACPHGLNVELALLLNAANRNDAEAKIQQLCAQEWDQVPTSTFQNIDSEFAPNFMNEYTQGDTFLNTETGNFQGADNPLHPSTPRTRQVGENINNFRNGLAQTTVLEAVGTLDYCAYQSMLCCFGRDRQSNDNNGDCSDKDCDNQGPADNSNLCYVELPEFMAYPGEDEVTGGEGAIHCHGLAWDSDPNDPTARFRFNNFFFVSLYDHMYSRGYVENMIDSDFVPMCGCTEAMPAVARADCTQINVDTTFLLNTSTSSELTVSLDSLTVNFNSCRGKDFTTGENSNNDLAAHVNRLVLQGRMDVATQMAIYKTLVGYAVDDNDDNDAVCSAAVAAYTP